MAAKALIDPRVSPFKVVAFSEVKYTRRTDGMWAVSYRGTRNDGSRAMGAHYPLRSLGEAVASFLSGVVMTPHIF